MAWVTASLGWSARPAMAAWGSLTMRAGLKADVDVTSRLPTSTNGSGPGGEPEDPLGVP